MASDSNNSSDMFKSLLKIFIILPRTESLFYSELVMDRFIEVMKKEGNSQNKEDYEQILEFFLSK